MNKLPENYFHTIICDPPYDLVSIIKRFGGKTATKAKVGKDGSFQRLSGGFMQKKWDGTGIAFKKSTWEAAYRVLRPGGFLVAFGGERTEHRMTTAIEDVGLIIRHKIMYLYGTGFAKGQNVSKFIDKELGKTRTKNIGPKINTYDGAKRNPKKHGNPAAQSNIGKWGLTQTPHGIDQFAAVSKQAKFYEGFNSALKPSYEPIVIAQKPLSEKTIAKNVLKWGTGAFNIDACRISLNNKGEDKRLGGKGAWGTKKAAKNVYAGGYAGTKVSSSAKGRYPANTIIDGSPEVMAEFAKYGSKKSGTIKPGFNIGKTAPNEIYGKRKRVEYVTYGDEGTVARFFYCAKANKLDRAMSKHPTVKGQNLMRYLCKLFTKPGGKILDPFAGSGSTLQAALQEGFKVVGIEKEKEYCKDIVQRMRLYRQGHLENIKTFNAYKAAQLEKEKTNVETVRRDTKQSKSSVSSIKAKSKKHTSVAPRPKKIKKASSKK